MKDFYRIGAIVVFGIWLLIVWKSSFMFAPKVITLPTEQPMTDTGTETQNVKKEENNPYLSIIGLVTSPFAASRYQPLLDHNIFVKPEAPQKVFTPDDLTFVSAAPANLPFSYSGYIRKTDGTIIAQVNWSGKTYFVKKGEKFKDYKVLDIQMKSMKVSGKEGDLIMELKKPVKSKEYAAKLYNTIDGKTYEVRKQDEIGGYKILDIKPGSVILYGQNKEWAITKGR